MICAGIDAGSRSIKIVLTDTRERTIIGSGVTDQGVDQTGLAGELLAKVLTDAALKSHQVAYTVATGYGRVSLDFADTTITEITCHARGVHHHRPDARTVIDIGGQDSKVLRLEEGGRVRDFALNDRCAAGTGRFLEVVAERFAIRLNELGTMAGEAEEPCSISSMCVVFAETEIVGLLAAGENPAAIVAGVQHSVAARIATMSGTNTAEPIVFTGGVAMIPGMDQAISKVLDKPVEICPSPQMTGALGAALLACERLDDEN